MAINRTPYNNLIDDDGSNTVGSVWNKAAIKDVLLDPIDVALFDQHIATSMADVAYNAANFAAGSGTWAVAVGNVYAYAYARVGPVVHLSIYLQNTTLSATPSNLTIAFPVGGVTWSRYVTTPVALKIGNATSEMGIAQALPGTSTISIYRNFLVAPFPAGALDLGVAITLPLT